jgi:hypothetical protein
VGGVETRRHFFKNVTVSSVESLIKRFVRSAVLAYCTQRGGGGKKSPQLNSRDFFASEQKSEQKESTRCTNIQACISKRNVFNRPYGILTHFLFTFSESYDFIVLEINEMTKFLFIQKNFNKKNYV